MDVSAWISYRASVTPDDTVLRFEGRTTSYGELEERIARTASTLRGLGVGRGDRVAYLGPNCPELLESFFACARIGAISVPLNARMPAAELGVFIELSDPAVVLAERDLVEQAGASVPKLRNRVSSFVVGRGDLSAAATEPVRLDPGSDAAAPVLIAFTSGTTGTPK